MFGKPVIEGARIALQLIEDRLDAGLSVDFILEQTPRLNREGALAAKAHADDKQVMTAAA